MGKTGSDFDPDAYAPVAERIRLFYEAHPTGRIKTELVRRTREEVVFRALIYRNAADVEPAATGWAAEREGDGEINLVACLENTETSAIGRALANLGFTASRQRPSAEEMMKASRVRARLATPYAVPTRVIAACLQPTVFRPTASPSPQMSSPYEPNDLRVALIDDLLADLRRAERLGVRPARLTRWRASLTSATHDADTLARCAARLRRWVAARRT
jgi:hypothetical protein